MRRWPAPPAPAWGSLDRASGQNGDTLRLTITPHAADPSLRGEAFFIFSEYGTVGTADFQSNVSDRRNEQSRAQAPLWRREPIAFDSRRAYCNANASPSSSNSIVPFLLDFSTSTAVVPEAGAVAVAVTVAWPPRGMSRCMVP